MAIEGAIGGNGNLAVPGNDQLILSSGFSSLSGSINQSGSSNLTISGLMTLGGALNESGSSNLSVPGNLSVGGALTLSGSSNLSVAGTLSVAGAPDAIRHRQYDCLRFVGSNRGGRGSWKRLDFRQRHNGRVYANGHWQPRDSGHRQLVGDDRRYRHDGRRQ